jgi:hypothetical protein
MTAQVSSSLAGLPVGLDQPPHSADSKKEDDGFDAALGMAMFAIPPGVTTPIRATNSGPQGSAGSTADGVSAVSGRQSNVAANIGAHTTAYVAAQSGSGDLADGDESAAAPSSHPADAVTLSFANLVGQSFAASSQTAGGSNQILGQVLADTGASVSQSASAQAVPQGQTSSLDSSGATSVGGAEAAGPVDNFIAGAFAASVRITYQSQAASDASVSGQVSSFGHTSASQDRAVNVAATGSPAADPSTRDSAPSVRNADVLTNQTTGVDGTPAFAPAANGTGVDGTPAFAPAANGTAVDGTPAFAPAANGTGVDGTPAFAPAANGTGVDGTPAFAPPANGTGVDGTPAFAPAANGTGVDGTPAFAPPTNGTNVDGTPAFASAANGTGVDGTPAFAPPTTGTGVDGTPAFAPPKQVSVARQSATATGGSFQSGVADIAGSASSDSAVEAKALQTAAATAPPSSSAQPKSSATRANVAAAEDPPASTALTTHSNADAAGQQGSLPDNPVAPAASAVAEEAGNGFDASILAANNKRNLGPRPNSDATGAHGSTSANADMPTASAPAEAGGGASQTSASAAVTMPTFTPTASNTRVANLTIDLASGQTTQATVREHSGVVDVRIVTPSQQSAQAIGSEIPALRRALDGVGLQLKAADVSYRGDSQRGDNGRQQQNQSPRNQSGDNTTFAIEEVNQ